MSTNLVSHRGVALSNYEGNNTPFSPSDYDAKQFYDEGSIIGGIGAGPLTVNIPAGLPRGWRTRISAALQGLGAIIAPNAAYTTVNVPGGVVAPFFIPPGGWCDVEVVLSNEISLMYGAGAGVGGGAQTVLNRTALAAIPPGARYTGMQVMVLTDGSLWRFNASSTLAADYTGTVAIPAGAVTAANLVIVPATGTGRWLRADKAFIARIPFVQATANAAVLWTPPTGVMVRMTGQPFWNVTSFTAGDGARRIGASSSSADAEFTAVGDLLGGTGGQLPVLGVTPGVVGDAFLDSDAANTSLATLQKLVMPLGAGTTGIGTVRYDIMVAGTDQADGMICIPVAVEMTTAMIS